MSEKSSLENKTALVTGSTAGLGRCIARALAEAGCNVVLNGFGDADAIEEQRRELAALHGKEIIYHDADLTRPGEITAMTAQHAQRQGTRVGKNIAAALGHGRRKPYKHRNLGFVVDLGGFDGAADPLGIALGGFPAKVVTRAYHLYAIPRFVNRWAVSLAYLTDAVFDRSVVSIGLSTAADAQFSASEGLPMPTPD